MPLYRAPLATTTSSQTPVTVSTLSSLPPLVKTSRWYQFPNGGAMLGKDINTVGMWGIPVNIPADQQLTAAVTIDVTIAVAGATVRAALYSCDAALEPSNLVLDLGSVDASTQNAKTFPTRMPLSKGSFVVALSGAGAGVRLRGVNATIGNLVPRNMSPDSNDNFWGIGWYRHYDVAANGWPATYGWTSTMPHIPRVVLVT